MLCKIKMKTSQALPWSAQGEKEGICDLTQLEQEKPGCLDHAECSEKALPRLTLGKENTVTRKNTDFQCIHAHLQRSNFCYTGATQTLKRITDWE